MKMKSVQSLHPCKSVIQTIYDIVKALGGELSVRTPLEKVETKEARPDDPVGRGLGLPAAEAGSEFIVELPLKQNLT